MKRLHAVFLLISMLVFLSAAVNAISPEEVNFDNVKKLIEEKYNPNAEKLPGSVKSLFGNERINLNIDDETIGIVTENAKAVEITNATISDPSLIVNAKKTDIATIMNSENPESAFNAAVKSKGIEVKSVGASSWLKLLISKILMFVARLLGY